MNETYQTKVTPQSTRYNSQTNSDNQLTFSTAVALPKHEISGDMKALDEHIESMITRGENMVKGGREHMVRVYVCKVCGKESRKHDIQDHIEANHLKGISVPCNLCEKTFRSRNSLRCHNSKFHRDSN